MSTAENVLTTESINNNLCTKARPWIVCLAAGLFFFYEFIQMQMFNAISTDLMQAFNIDAGALGLLSATYLLADVIFLFPAGMILDRVSVRKIIMIAMLVCILGTYGFSLSHSFLVAGFFHFLAGIGNAFCFLSCIMLASRWFPPKKLALIIGVIVTMAMIGGAVAQTPLTLLSHAYGWRHALALNAILGGFIFAVIFFTVRDFPSAEYEEKYFQQRQKVHQLGLIHSIKLALGNLQNWLCGIYTSFLNLPIMVIGAVMGKLYLTQARGLNETQASNVVMMIFIGTIIGSPLIGWISDQVSLRKKPMIIGAVLSIISLIAIMYLPNPSYPLFLFLFFALGFFTSAQIVGYPTIAESNPRSLTGAATGVASVLIMGGAMLAQPLYGFLLDLRWNGTELNHIPIYSTQNFHEAMLLFPIAFIIALLAACKIKETHCTHHE